MTANFRCGLTVRQRNVPSRNVRPLSHRSVMTFYLRTFGPIELLTADGERVPGAGVQPKPLLILALAALTPGGIARDRLLRAIWPGVERDRAGASLKQHLYALRRATGIAAIVADAGRIAVPAGSLRVDALEFNDLVDRGRLPEASRLLRGDLLDGIDLDERAGGELGRLVADLRDRWANRIALVRSRTPPVDIAEAVEPPPGEEVHRLACERELRAATADWYTG